MKKQRKPRTKGYDMHFDGAHINGNPIHFNHSPAIDKIKDRYRNKVCLGCGKKECKCKSKSNII